jgi:hypothetical protein
VGKKNERARYRLLFYVSCMLFYWLKGVSGEVREKAWGAWERGRNRWSINLNCLTYDLAKILD